MYYIDTSILVSYVFSSEKGHKRTRELLDSLSRESKLYISSYALVELYNTVCRKIANREIKLAEPLDTYLKIYSDKDIEKRLKFIAAMVVSFLLRKLNLKIVDNSHFYQQQQFKVINVSIPLIFRKCIELSHKLRLRIKDLLHVVYACLSMNQYNIKYIVTGDAEDFNKVRRQLKELGLELITVEV